MLENIRNKIKDVLGSELFMVLLIFAFAIGLRIWNLETLPPGIAYKESLIFEKIKSLNFSNMWLGGEFFNGLYIYLGLLATKLFGQSALVLRALSAIIGSATVLLGYVFIREWFSRKVAIFSMFLFAVSSFHINISRLIQPEITLPFIVLSLFIALTYAYRTKNIWLFGLSGILLGLGFYTSPAFILLPLMFLFAGIYFVKKNKKFFTAYKEELLVSLAAFVAVLIPVIVSFFYHPMSYLTNFGFYRSPIQFLLNINETFRMLFVATDSNFFMNLGTEPLFDPFICSAFVVGVILALLDLKRRKYFFIVLWFVFFALFASLKRGTQIQDLVGLIPVIMVFSAISIDYLIDIWLKTFPFNKKARLLIIAVISIFFSLSGLYNYDKYFVAYKGSKEVQEVFYIK